MMLAGIGETLGQVPGVEVLEYRTKEQARAGQLSGADLAIIQIEAGTSGSDFEAWAKQFPHVAFLFVRSDEESGHIFIRTLHDRRALTDVIKICAALARKEEAEGEGELEETSEPLGGDDPNLEAPPFWSPEDHLRAECQLLEAQLRLAIESGDFPDSIGIEGVAPSKAAVLEALASTGDLWAPRAPRIPDATRAEELAQAIRNRREYVEARRRATGGTLPLDTQSQALGLDRMAERCFLLSVAVRRKPSIRRAVGYLLGDPEVEYVTRDIFERVLATEGEERELLRRALEPTGPLIASGLLLVPEGAAGERVTSFDAYTACPVAAGLLEHPLEKSPELQAYLSREVDDASSDVDLTNGTADKLARVVRGVWDERHGEAFVLIHGPEGSGRRALARRACRMAPRGMLLVDVDRVLQRASNPARVLAAIVRVAYERRLVLLLNRFELLGSGEGAAHRSALVDALNTFENCVLLVSTRSWKPDGELARARFMSVEMGRPDEGQRAALWLSEAGRRGWTQIGEEQCDELAGLFRFTPGQIAAAADALESFLRFEGRESASVVLEDVTAACRNEARERLNAFTTRIEPTFAWDDLVLEEEQSTQLKEIIALGRHRKRVLSDWGFRTKLSLGEGIVALFAGPSGTGKTMAAEVIARCLGIDLYKLDLARVLSRYVGDFEQRIGSVFDEAELADALLFIDECDTVLGTRTATKTAQDRFANFEVGYLLQRIEEYRGLAVLATNLRRNLDDAFVRRLNAVVEFNRPDVDLRERIWQRSVPYLMPLGRDVDLRFLAERFDLAGGHIKTALYYAAHLAAAEGGAVHMRHILRAVAREQRKLGVAVKTGDYKPYKDDLEIPIAALCGAERAQEPAV